MRHRADTPLELSDFSIVYFNSSGNESGRIRFSENQILVRTDLVLGFAKSPQFSDFSDTAYTYNFGSSGLASTSGKVQLLQGDTLIDEICWGKLECEHPNPKFNTKQEDNASLVLCESEQCDSTYLQQAYYPEIIESIEIVNQPENNSCDGLIISEILSYYSEDPTEQYIELYNYSHESINLSSCQLIYKNKEYPLDGELASFEYYVYQNSDLTLTKDPTSYNTYSIKYASGDIFYEVILPHGQKKGTSYAIFHPNSPDEQ